VKRRLTIVSRKEFRLSRSSPTNWEFNPDLFFTCLAFTTIRHQKQRFERPFCGCLTGYGSTVSSLNRKEAQKAQKVLQEQTMETERTFF
jgi:hypothetical protein